MEDDDTDAEMVDYHWHMMGRTFRTMSTQTLSEFTAVDARTSLGNRESDPPFPRFWGGFPDSRFPIGRESGRPGARESGIGIRVGPFPDRPGTGNRGPDSAGRGFPGLVRPRPRVCVPLVAVIMMSQA